MHYVIFTGGQFNPHPLFQKILQEADTIIAADSGADTAVLQNIFPSVVVGDMDSLSQKTQKLLQQHGSIFSNMPTTLVSVPFGKTRPPTPSEKDQTDTELAIAYALQHGATKITILGGIAGNRLDHIIANILLATMYPIPMQFLSVNQIAWVGKGPTKQVISGEKGDTLSLIPLSQKVEGITSTGLYYPLTNDTFVFGKPRGVSNVLTTARATVSFKKGTLLFVHTIHEWAE